MDIEEIEITISNWARKKSELQKVWLFGSRVKGMNRADSDLDVAVETFPGKKGEILWYKVHQPWKSELDELIPFEIHLEWYDPDGSTPTCIRWDQVF